MERRGRRARLGMDLGLVEQEIVRWMERGVVVWWNERKFAPGERNLQGAAWAHTPAATALGRPGEYSARVFADVEPRCSASSRDLDVSGSLLKAASQAIYIT
jgi:hypothetical protein